MPRVFSVPAARPSTRESNAGTRGHAAYSGPVIDIRPAAATDVEAIQAIAEAAYQGYVPRVGGRPAPMDADYDDAVRRGCVWVATDSGAVAGVLVLIPQTDHLLLENIAVTPTAQGRGIGNQLLAFAEDTARRRGFDEIRLYTHETMIENLAYYARHGYNETHRAVDHGFHRVFLSKALR